MAETIASDRMAQTAARADGWSPLTAAQGVSPWLFLVPALVFFVGYQVYPIFRVLWISFTDYQYLSNEPANWVGLRQLRRRRSTTR